MIVLNLVQNIALLLALVAIEQMIARGKLAGRLKSYRLLPLAVSGLAFGGIGILGMMTPLRFSPGIIFDGRSIILAVAGLFGGPVVAAIAGAMCAGFRLSLGGAGTLMGVCVISEAAGLGVLFHQLRKRHPSLSGYPALWAFGLLVHAVMMALMLLLPRENRWEVVRQVGPAVMLVYPVATMIVCRLFIDQEEHNFTETALLQSEVRYRELVEQANSIILRWNVWGRITFCNDYGLRFFGFGHDELVGRELVGTIVPAKDSAGKDLARMVRDIAAHPERFEVNENENTRKDGSRVWVAWTNRPVLDAHGKCGEILAVGNDITARKHAEDALRENNELFSLFMKYSPIFAFIKSVTPTESRVIQASENFRDMVGIAGSDMVGKTMEELFPAEFARKITADDWTVVSSRTVVRLEEELNGRNYTTFKFPIVLGGKTLLAGYTIDITERKRAEEDLALAHQRLQRFVDANIIGVVLATAQGGILEANDYYLNLLGYSRREFAAGMVNWREVTPPEWLPEDERAIQELRTRGKCPPYEKEYLRRDGSRVPVLLADAMLPGTAGEMAAFVLDLTEQRRAEKEKAELEAQLRQIQKMETVGRLAGGVAHDFNNMLGVILGFSELALCRNDLAGDLRDDITEIQKAARRSAELTSQLLAFARRQTVSPRVLDLNETIKGLLKMLERIVGENIRVRWLPGPNLWPVSIDPSQVEQVVANLCVNARDAIVENGRITIETANRTCDALICLSRPGLEPGDYAMLVVSDNGRGMDKETVDKVFEPFFTTKGLGQGTGLGLATVYGIVKQNGGHINVYSEVGQGSAFTVYLPRHVGEPGQTAQENADATPPRGTETVLVVEDEKALLKLVHTVLEGLGYTVLIADDPAEAIRIADRHRSGIDLLLTDVVMPEMSGPALANQLLSRCGSLKCLFMSGYTADTMAERGVVNGQHCFLQKPFSALELALKTREALDKDR